MEFNTLNKFMVASHGLDGDVRLMRPPARETVLTKHDALVLAAWLVAMVDQSPDYEDFHHALLLVEGT